MADFPKVRMRRMRQSEIIRGLVRETHLNIEQLIYPLFIAENIEEPREISSMPGIMQWPLKYVGQEAKRIAQLGIPAVLLFGIPSEKDEVGLKRMIRRASYNRPFVVSRHKCQICWL